MNTNTNLNMGLFSLGDSIKVVVDTTVETPEQVIQSAAKTLQSALETQQFPLELRQKPTFWLILREELTHLLVNLSVLGETTNETDTDPFLNLISTEEDEENRDLFQILKERDDD